MPRPWEKYSCTIPGNGKPGTGSVMDVVHHVTHTPAALRIIEDRKISRGLIYDECILNDSRTTVAWLSPNEWSRGSRYGNVEFTYDFSGLVAGRRIYWVEAQTKYTPTACRFLITDEDVKQLPVLPYDPAKEDGPLRHAGGLWYWNFRFTGEFMLQATLYLTKCRKVSFIKHHDLYCSSGGCNDLGKTGERAAGRIIAQILSLDSSAIDDPLTVTEPKRALSTAVDLGLTRIRSVLGATSGKLKGPLNSNASVDAALRAALLQHAHGETVAAQQTTSLIGSDDLFRRRLAALVEDHFGLKSSVLSV